MLTRHFSYKNVFEIVRKATFSEKTHAACSPSNELKILVGKSNGSRHSVWEASENMDCGSYFHHVKFCSFLFDAHDFYAVGL